MSLEEYNNNAGPSEDSRIAAELAEAISEDDSFTTCIDQETDDEEDDALTSFEVIQQTMIERDNRDINTQLERDIQMLSQAIVQYGKSESDKTKAHTLLKSVLLLYFGDISYRDKQDKQFHSWRELHAHSKLETFPIASVLLHGSRALIEFPSEISEQLIKWLIPDQTSWRHAATHGIKTTHVEESQSLANKPPKYLQEIKVGLLGAGYQTAAQMLPGSMYQHYGIDVALGGAGNKNHYSDVIIEPNGEHGHLYVYHAAEEGEHGGLLLGIEQSAPGKSDQYGGSHDMGASPKTRSASGGDFFCKKGALENLPIDNYYDSLWNFISNQNFALIQESYKTVCVVLDLLRLDPRTEDEGINLIKEIISSSGQGNEQTMDELCNKYFLKTNLYSSLKEEFNSKLKRLEGEKKSLQTHFNTMLQSHTRSFTARSKYLMGSVQQLTEENEALQQQLAQYKAAESQREEPVARENKLAAMKDLQALAIMFMHNVKNNMGRFSKNSKKAVIFTQLINQLEGKNANELREDDLAFLLKRFIGVAMMNRHDKKGGETHSGKTCLSLLNDSNYKPLKSLLFSKQDSLVRDDLLALFKLSNNNDQKFLTSARYQQSLYNVFGLAKNYKNIPNDKLDLVMQEFVHKL